MIILSPTLNLSQTIRVTPRRLPSTQITLIDEETKLSHTFNAQSISSSDNYVTIIFTINTNAFPSRIIEGKYYMLILRLGNQMVLRERVFCTNQPKASFSTTTDLVSMPNPNNFISI